MLFDLLVSYGADVSLSLKKDKELPALFAATTYQGVKAVLDAGGDVSQRNTKGDTALHQHRYYKSPEAIRLLIERGADPAVKNNEGLSAIKAAMNTRDAFRQRLAELTLAEQHYVMKANYNRDQAIGMERIIAAMEGHEFDEVLIATQYPPIEDNRLEQASQAVINNNSGEYLSPYTSDGVTAEWVNQAINAGIGAQVGVVAGAATGSAVAGSAVAGAISDNFASVALVSMAGAAIGEAIGRQAAIEASGGWDHIRATSDISFNSLENMARYLRLKQGNDENFKEVFKATLLVYPELSGTQ